MPVGAVLVNATVWNPGNNMDIFDKIELDKRLKRIRDKGFCIETGKWDKEEKIGPYARIYGKKISFFEVHGNHPDEENLKIAIKNWEEKESAGQLGKE